MVMKASASLMPGAQWYAQPRKRGTVARRLAARARREPRRHSSNRPGRKRPTVSMTLKRVRSTCRRGSAGRQGA